MTIEEIKDLADDTKFEIEGRLEDDENRTVEIYFHNNKDEDAGFTAEVYCRNYDDGPDPDEYHGPMSDCCETKIQTEIEIESLIDQDGNEIKLSSVAEQALVEILFKKCF